MLHQKQMIYFMVTNIKIIYICIYTYTHIYIYIIFLNNLFKESY